jgi:hypothetical protein
MTDPTCPETHVDGRCNACVPTTPTAREALELARKALQDIKRWSEMDGSWSEVNHRASTTLAALAATEATDPLTARVAALEAALRDLADYVEGFVGSAAVHSIGYVAAARALLPPADGSRVERCGHCGEAWPCWQYRVDPVDSHHRPEGAAR